MIKLNIIITINIIFKIPIIFIIIIIKPKKEFIFSRNSLNSRENPINSVANFRISTTSLNTSNNNNNISNDQMNKYRSILDFGQANNNINSKIISVQNTENKTSTPDNNNKTPSIHKKNGEVDYEKNYLPQKKSK